MSEHPCVANIQIGVCEEMRDIRQINNSKYNIDKDEMCIELIFVIVLRGALYLVCIGSP